MTSPAWLFDALRAFEAVYGPTSRVTVIVKDREGRRLGLVVDQGLPDNLAGSPPGMNGHASCSLNGPKWAPRANGVAPVGTICTPRARPALGSEIDQTIMRAAASLTQPVTSKRLAHLAGYKHNSYFLQAVTRLVRGHFLIRTADGLAANHNACNGCSVPPGTRDI